ncbi:MAG: Gfo/Idh/MocA family oxidoreductase [Planctomycetota bacterium]
MAERKLGAAVFGAGWVAGEHIKAYARNPHCEVVAVGSRRLESARSKAAECTVDCAVCDDFDQILRDKRVDIVSITTPNAAHTDLGVRAARAGKHILMEKPMSLTHEENRRLRDEVRKAGVRTVVSFVLHWNPLFRIIREQLADGAVGRVFYAEVDYFHAVGPWYGCYAWNQKKEEGGSSLLSAGCHAVDALRYFVGDEVVEVSAYSTRSDAPPFDVYEYDPTTVLIARFAGGALGKVASCIECNSPYTFNILLMGDKGTIRDNHYYGAKCLGTHGHPEIGEGQYGWATWPTVLPDSGDVTHHPFYGEIDELVSCILEGRESHLNVEDAYKTHEVCFAADRSAREGKPVRLPLKD